MNQLWLYPYKNDEEFEFASIHFHTYKHPNTVMYNNEIHFDWAESVYNRLNHAPSNCK
jgi:hypothetical protein